jgi:hypothetical protein
MRRSNWTPAVVPTDRDSNLSGADTGRSRTEREWGNEQPKEVRPFEDSNGPQDVLATAAQETLRRADLAFSVGVALALALPAFLGIFVYVASLAIFRAS